MSLMPSGEHVFSDERRQNPRSLVSVPLRIYAAGRRLLMQARTIDLSVAGALVHGSAPLRVGQTVAVEVERGVARNPLTLQAEVVRIATPNARLKRHGIALRFLGVSPLDEAIIESIIASARGI